MNTNKDKNQKSEDTLSQHFFLRFLNTLYSKICRQFQFLGFGGALVLSWRLSLATVSAWECSFECPVSLKLCFKIITPLKLDSGALVVDIHLPPPNTHTAYTGICYVDVHRTGLC